MYYIGLFVYFMLLVVIGVYQSRKNPDFDAYFYGKRKLGTFLIFFTVTASWFGAASTIATVDAAQKNGFQAVWLLGIPTIATMAVFLLLNKKIRETRFVSLPVLLNKYYGKIVSGFASFLIFFYMALMAASQFVAWGKFIGTFTGQGYEITVITGAVVVIVYSYLGGYFSVVLTDGLQFLLLTIALVYLVLFFKGSMLQYNPGDFNIFADPPNHILMTLSFTLAWVISPIIWQRIASARSARSSRWGLVLSIIAFSALYILVILVGIYLRGVPVEGVAGEAGLFGFVIKNWLPAGGSLLVFLGIAAAIMSTGDTAINMAALTLVKDVFHIEKKSRIVFYARIATFISGILAAVIALKFSSIIKILGLASEIMAEGLFIPGMYLLFFKKKRPLAALLSLFLGGGFSLIVFLQAYGVPFNFQLPQWPYSLPYGLALSATGFIIGYLFDRRHQ
jgi:solute:Na+ symporter, SSS family